MYCIENEVIVIEELVILYLMDIWNIWIFVWGKIIEVYKVVFIIVRKCVKFFIDNVLFRCLCYGINGINMCCIKCFL